MTASGEHLLTVKDLSIHIPTAGKLVRAVDGVSIAVERGKTLALVGESGSGKSMFCRAIMGLLPSLAFLPGPKRIVFDGRDLTQLTERELNYLRGREIGIVLQNPLSSLNPVLTIGRQLMEPMLFHLGTTKKEAKERALELLHAVGISRGEERLKCYPHQLSGGMRQRVAIAMAISCEPKLLIADEPTTALDVTVQAEILNLLDRLQRERNMAMILVTHDLGVVAGRAHDTAVMYAGKIVEHAPTGMLFDGMRMPYTKALFDSIPRLDGPSDRLLAAIGGNLPDLAALPGGCRFAPRCSAAQERCRMEEPPLVNAENAGHQYACWFPCGERSTSLPPTLTSPAGRRN